MKVVVTGACGFAGSSIVRRFAEAKAQVVAIDICPPSRLVDWFWRDHRHNIDFRTADIRGEWTEGLGRVDVVAHAATATYSRPAEEIDRSADLIGINTGGTERIVSWAARAGVRRVIVVSTATVYGHNQRGVSVGEDAVPRPETVYAIARLAGDDIALRLADRLGVDVRVARLTYLYGPMERRTCSRTLLSPIHDWCIEATRGTTLSITDPGAQMDYLHVTDAAKAIWELAFGEKLEHDVYNVGPGVATTLESAAEIIAESTGCGTNLRPGVPRLLRPALDVGRLVRDLGFGPSFDIEHGLQAYVGWIRSIPPQLLEELE